MADPMGHGTNPSDLNPPVPNTGTSVFDAPDEIAPLSTAPVSVFDLPEEDITSTPVSQFPGAGLVQGTLDALPMAGGLAGAVVGSPAGPAGTIGGAMAGGVAGQSLRSTLQSMIFGNQQTSEQLYKDLAVSGLTEGAGAATGEILGKVASAALKTKAGQWVAQKGAELAEAPTQYLRDSVQSLRDRIEAPVMRILTGKSTSLTTEGAGDTVKSLLKDNIKTKYGGFVQAYEDLDQVSQALPLTDRSRYAFTERMKAWGMNLSSDEQQVVKNFAEKLNAADNGMKFQNEVKRLRGTIRELSQRGDTELAATLREARDRATDYFEGETTKLAARIKANKATPQEMGFLDQIIKQRGIQEEVPGKYAKQLADDYIKSLSKVKQDYAGFRGFLEDVGEQTRVRTNKGPMAFLDSVDDVTSEKLIERMFDPKNARALRTMQKETPEVYDMVIKSKMTELMRASGEGGTLNIHKLYDKLDKMPPATRAMLMNSDEMKSFVNVINSPNMRVLDKVSKSFVGKIASSAVDIVDVARIVTAQEAKSFAKTQPGRQFIGRGVNKLVEK